MATSYYPEEKKIRIYHTHIEVSPYELGENERIERQLSVWVDAEYRYDPIGYYVEDNVLYLPRGMNVYILEKEFNSTAVVVREADNHDVVRRVEMTVAPRDRIQDEAIDFLTAEGEFKKALTYSQQALVLDTGDGKTYTTVNGIVQWKMKAIIITHQDKIKLQWIDTFETKTNVRKSYLINITSSDMIDKIIDGKISGFYYFVNHQTLTSYMSSRGTQKLREFFKAIRVGVKVFDEAHLAFKNVLRIDFFSNTMKTFYLTANFDRSDSKESRLFKKCFASVYKFGEETKEYEEKRKHIIYVPVLYRSHPTFNQEAMARNAYGFSVLGFSKYALYEDEEATMLRKFRKIFEIATGIEGKILITVPRIDDTEMMKSLIEKEYPDLGKSIMTINSSNTKKDNDEAKQNADIICSTIKSCGTGVDIKGLRCVINLEPFSSKITSNQLSGRLREYAPDKDTYFFDLVDCAFSTCEHQYKTKLGYLKKKCKEIRVMKSF